MGMLMQGGKLLVKITFPVTINSTPSIVDNLFFSNFIIFFFVKKTIFVSIGRRKIFQIDNYTVCPI